MFKLKKILLFILILFSLGSASLNIYFYKKSKFSWSIERNLGGVPSLELNPQYYTQRDWNRSIKSLNENVDVAFIGDSITAGGNWADYFEDIKLCSLGLSGDFCFNMARRASILKELKPKKIFILIGVNDLSRFVDPVENLARDYRNMLSTITKENPEAKIYCQSLLPTRGAFASKKEKILESNLKIMEISKDFPTVEFIDIHSIFLDDNAMLKAEYSRDGLHINDLGYELWSTFIKDKVM